MPAAFRDASLPARPPTDARAPLAANLRPLSSWREDRHRSPFSWSFWGGVVEHAELQAEALEARGREVRLVMGNDPPGQFTRALHPGSAVTATRRRT